MKQISIITYISCALSFLLSCNGLADSNTSRAEEIIGKHTIRFTTPPERTPVQYAVVAPLLGNGFTGIALAGVPDYQTFYVARNDFWRLKSALYESYPVALW